MNTPMSNKDILGMLLLTACFGLMSAHSIYLFILLIQQEVYTKIEVFFYFPYVLISLPVYIILTIAAIAVIKEDLS